MKKIILFVFSLFFISCSKSPEKPIEIQYFFQGDVSAFYQGTSRNTTLPSANDFSKSFNNYAHNMTYSFQNKAQLQTYEEMVEEQVTTDQQEKEYSTYALKKSGDEYIYQPQSNLKDQTQFIFTQKDNKLNLKSLNFTPDRENDLKAKLIHFSSNEEHESFSLLVLIEEDGFQLLITYYFSNFSPLTSQIQELSHEYEYLLGSGKSVKWLQNTSSFELCGSNHKYDVLVESATQRWQEEIGHVFDLKLSRNVNNYPPFSDVNSHCIYQIDSYQMASGDEGFIPAATTFGANVNNGDLYDSDIFIFSEELTKQVENDTEYYEDEVSESTLKYILLAKIEGTMIHELGHAIGLGHQFNSEHTSVMSYDGIHSIQTHDIEALEELYSQEDTEDPLEDEDF